MICEPVSIISLAQILAPCSLVIGWLDTSRHPFTVGCLVDCRSKRLYGNTFPRYTKSQIRCDSDYRKNQCGRHARCSRRLDS
jgi:hypothetical protein